MRTCISCGTQFEGEADDIIPVCPDCRTDPGIEIEPETRSVWKVIKEGKDFELESEGAVRQWILQGLILPTDLIVLPDGNRSQANALRAFQDAFRTLRYRQAATISPLKSFGRFSFSSRWFFQFFLVALLSSAIAWTLYRVVRYQPTSHSTFPLRDKLVAQLREQIPAANRSADVLFENGKALLQSNHPEAYESARRLLEQALTLDPENGNLLGNLAVAYAYSSELGDEPRLQVTALDIADLALSISPNQPEGYIAKIRSALSANNFSLALEAAQKAETLFPRSGALLITYAAILLAKAKEPQEISLAISKATQGLQTDPTLLEGYDVAGMGYFLRGEPDQARGFFEQRMTRAPNDPAAPYRMGLLDERAENQSAAMEWYQESLRAEPSFVPSRLALCRLLQNEEEAHPIVERHLREILTRYRRFAHTSEIFGAQRMLTRILLRTRRPGEAKDLVDQFPPLLASSPQFAISRASVLEALGSPSEALATLGDASKTEPNNSELRLALARTQERFATVNEALRGYRETLSIAPNWILPYFFLARLILQKSEPDEALDVASAAATKAGLAPVSDLWDSPSMEEWSPPWSTLDHRFSSLVDSRATEPTAHALLGLLRLTQGEAEQNVEKIRSALRPFQRARELAPSLEYPHIYWGRTQFALKNWDAAATAFRQAVKNDPVSAMSHYWLGMTYLKMKKWNDASTEFNTAAKDSLWNYRALAGLGDIAMAKKDKAEAIAKWRESLQIEPRYMPPWRALLEATR